MLGELEHRRLVRGEVIRIHVSALTITSGFVWVTDDRGRDLLLTTGDRLPGGEWLVEALLPSRIHWTPRGWRVALRQALNRLRRPAAAGRWVIR
ncbi:hypothetical protein [Jeongeupia sp. USM3]|uniref:hypothetical protein n=1 Tax=Jeongeupia sp. USM3 TaxID=1906741 RepID=UPI00089DDE20|nr:hypothetical protein [Jeongeupia sp. USM3]AOY01398.1 hypothetical protein BJP62_13635 [Jeongeupia sp. USM3]